MDKELIKSEWVNLTSILFCLIGLSLTMILVKIINCIPLGLSKYKQIKLIDLINWRLPTKGEYFKKG